jgi:hypothetical protein
MSDPNNPTFKRLLEFIDEAFLAFADKRPIELSIQESDSDTSTYRGAMCALVALTLHEIYTMHGTVIAIPPEHLELGGYALREVVSHHGFTAEVVVYTIQLAKQLAENAEILLSYVRAMNLLGNVRHAISHAMRPDDDDLLLL